MCVCVCIFVTKFYKKVLLYLKKKIPILITLKDNSSERIPTAGAIYNHKKCQYVYVICIYHISFSVCVPIGIFLIGSKNFRMIFVQMSQLHYINQFYNPPFSFVPEALFSLKCFPEDSF